MKFKTCLLIFVVLLLALAIPFTACLTLMLAVEWESWAVCVIGAIIVALLGTMIIMIMEILT